MAQNYNNLTAGLNITTQIPLDVKKYVINEATLAYLGVSNNLAFTYHDQLIVTCLEEKTTWIWREVQVGEENTGLVNLDFTYPTLPETYGINYSGKTYNFLPYTYITAENIDDYVDTITGPAGPTGPAGRGITSITLTSTVGLVKTYTINYSDATTSTFQVTDGADGDDALISIITSDTNSITGSGTLVDPYKVNALNPQLTITGDLTLNNTHNGKTIFVDNSATDVNITVPSTLANNFCCAFWQLGTGNVTFVQGASTVINSNVGLKIKGQNLSVVLEKIEDSVEYVLGNATKV